MLTFTNENNHNFTLSAKYWSNIFQKTHTHTFWEILFLCKGTLINNLNKKEKEMNKYDVALIHPQDVHKLRAVPNVKTEYYNITIDDTFFKNCCNGIYTGLLDDLNNCDNLYITLSAHRHNKLLELLNLATITPNQEEAEKYYKIVLSYLLPEFIPLQNVQPTSAVSQALKIMSHPNNMHLTIKEIAKQIGYTPEHLTRLFQKENYGSPSQIFLELKMTHAKLLLQQTDLSVEEIANAIGMKSLPHFYRIFKEFFQTTPNAMRKNRWHPDTLH